VANATSRVQDAVVQWGDDKIYRVPVAVAQTFWPGAMIALNANANATKCDNTAGLKFDGICAVTDRLQINADDTLTTMALDKTKQVLVQRPFRIQMNINAPPAATDVGKLVYAVDDQTVSLTTTNSVRVGFLEKILSPTTVLIAPIYGNYTAT
jgi:hypothetical protein